jgi:putative flippase GtrA
MRDLVARTGLDDLSALASSQIGRFLAIGLTGLAVDTLAFTALHGVGLSHPVARALSMIAATSVTWTLNRTFTFAASGRRRREEIGRYSVVVVAAQGFSYGVFLAICAIIPHLPPVLALFAGAVAATGLSYCGQRYFTFAAAPQTRGA